jgi:hypothetical protein
MMSQMTMRLILATLLVHVACAQTSGSWSKLEFLLGNWTGAAGDKDTQIGAGEGAFSFQADLNQKIIVRKNSARYTTGVTHDDLMIIYLDAPDSTPRAIYFDSEGHIIRYNLTFPSANRAVFESEAGVPGPRYRLTYWLEGASLNGKFEIGSSPSDYKPYMSWTSRKR